MPTPIDIYGHKIAPGQPTLVIAEIGVNHNGSLARALELVEIAAECGADAVKLQIFHAASLMHQSASFAVYQRDRCDDASPAAMLHRYELSPEDIERIVEAIRNHNLLPIATPFSPSDVAIISELRLPAVKIASPDIVNRPLLLHAAELRKPLLVSTGAATLDEIDMAAGWMRQWNVPFALLHCVSAYPTPAHDANLCWIGELAARFDVNAGFSDHTTDELSGALAVAAGATVIEKHLTYDRAADGPDHAASSDPAQFARYVKLIRQADRLRGQPGKRVLLVEEDVRRVSRQSLVVSRALRPGDILREDDLTVKRPGTGIPAAQILRAVGRKILQPLDAGTLLRWEMLSDAA